MRSFLEKWKGFFTDAVWSTAALLLVNGVIQLAVYPLLSRYMGDERYGDFLYLMSLVNIVSVPVGGSVSSTRLKANVVRQTENGDYNILLLGAAVLSIPFAAAVARFGGVSMSVIETVLFWLLICATSYRLYSDVGFRLELNFRKFFLRYFFISLGYLTGILLFVATGYWALTMLLGEVLGILYAVAAISLFRGKPLLLSEQFRRTLSSYSYLLLSSFLVNLAYNADRSILKFMVGETAITIYYLASLAGKMISLVVGPLNTVIIGYLVRYKGSITKKLVFQISCVLVAMTVVGTFVCAGVSYVFISLFYPQNLEMVRPYILIASLPQLVYFSSSVFSTFLLRFSEEKYQLITNIAFLIALLCFALPTAKMWGITGFSVGFLLATIVRFIAILWATLRVCE